jgi:xylulokinase
MLLGIDLGTGSAKALLLATDGTAIGEASSSYPVHGSEYCTASKIKDLY